MYHCPRLEHLTWRRINLKPERLKKPNKEMNPMKRTSFRRKNITIPMKKMKAKYHATGFIDAVGQKKKKKKLSRHSRT